MFNPRLLVGWSFYKPLQAAIKDEAPPTDAGRFQRSVGNELEELRLSNAG